MIEITIYDNRLIDPAQETIETPTNRVRVENPRAEKMRALDDFTKQRQLPPHLLKMLPAVANTLKVWKKKLT